MDASDYNIRSSFILYCYEQLSKIAKDDNSNGDVDHICLGFNVGVWLYDRLWRFNAPSDGDDGIGVDSETCWAANGWMDKPCDFSIDDAVSSSISIAFGWLLVNLCSGWRHGIWKMVNEICE